MPLKKPYHHGDLRAALLHAVGKLIAERGIEGISLRECARRAGASWSAPAHHFGDKTGLLTAFAIEGFERLREQMEWRREHVKELAQQPTAVGEAYLEFALRNRNHFRVMFRAELLNEQDSAYQEACRSSFEVLEGTIKACDALLGFAETGQMKERCLLAWSTMHGFATLCLEGAILPDGRGLKAKTVNALETGTHLLQMLGPALFKS